MTRRDTAAWRALPGWLAVVLVAGTSGAVLVIEILAGRMLAPYVGVSIETYTAIIGTVLTGIAIGAATGGWLADRFDPRRLLPPLLVAGGALAILSIPIVRVLGDSWGRGATGPGSVVLAGMAFMPSAAVLSAVPPSVVKLQLRDLERTGATVGRLSAWGTAGAIAGTFLAGFVLVAYAAVTTLFVAVGVLVIAAGVAMWLTAPPRDLRAPASLVALAVLALAGVAWIDSPCDTQTAYYCVSIERDPEHASARVLVLDDLRHSYVDLADPTHLGFWYVRRITDAIDAFAPAGPLDVVSLGGGGLTVPRWLRATRPGSQQIVLEIDPELVDIVTSELGFRRGDDVDIRTGDGRVSLRALPADSADVIVGDAFGSRAVPWHLATEEFVAEIDRVLRPGGIYVANIIDAQTQDFLRAEAATIRGHLPEVAVMRSNGVIGGPSGNAVVVASDGPLDAADWDARRAAIDDDGAIVTDVDEYLDGALILTDDFAPVDQLLLGTR